jgi:hypothetical protein
MIIIPLDVQRRCEQRWAARFSRPTESVAPRNQRPERESSQQIAGPQDFGGSAHSPRRRCAEPNQCAVQVPQRLESTMATMGSFENGRRCNTFELSLVGVEPT